MNATSIAFDRQGQMYVSSRHDGAVYRVAPNGTMTTYAEGMGIATGIAFDREQSLYVGDRERHGFQDFPRPAGLRLCHARAQRFRLSPGVRPQGDLFVTGPTTSSYKIDPSGTVHTFYKGLGRPQGLAFDMDGNLYVAASSPASVELSRSRPTASPILKSAGQGLVGLAFAPGRSVVLATPAACIIFRGTFRACRCCRNNSTPPPLFV